MFIKSASCTISNGQMNGWRIFFLRRYVRKTAEEFGIRFEEVKQAISQAAMQNPGKTMIIVFSQTNDEPATMLVEDKETHFQRLFNRVERTGVFSISTL